MLRSFAMVFSDLFLKIAQNDVQDMKEVQKAHGAKTFLQNHPTKSCVCVCVCVCVCGGGGGGGPNYGRL